MELANALDPQKVRQWLKGQAKAQRIIERERRVYLSQLGTAEALQLYQGLLHSREHPSSDRPSVLLMAMRKAAANWSDSQGA